MIAASGHRAGIEHIAHAGHPEGQSTTISSRTWDTTTSVGSTGMKGKIEVK
jgi:hypothetical protein